jgi:hypothetical protein
VNIEEATAYLAGKTDQTPEGLEEALRAAIPDPEARAVLEDTLKRLGADGNVVYPSVAIEYIVQYQTRREPGIWWEAQADSTPSLAEAQDLSRRLMTGAAKPRGNDRAFVTKTRIAERVVTTTIVEGEGAPVTHRCDQLGHQRCSQNGKPE